MYLATNCCCGVNLTLGVRIISAFDMVFGSIYGILLAGFLLGVRGCGLILVSLFDLVEFWSEHRNAWLYMDHAYDFVGVDRYHRSVGWSHWGTEKVDQMLEFLCSHEVATDCHRYQNGASRVVEYYRSIV
jgi:hypothetical protein